VLTEARRRRPGEFGPNGRQTISRRLAVPHVTPLARRVRYLLMMMLPMRVSLTPSSHDFLGEAKRQRAFHARHVQRCATSVEISGGGRCARLR